MTRNRITLAVLGLGLAAGTLVGSAFRTETAGTVAPAGVAATLMAVPAVGEKAPELVGNTPDGKTIKLSDMKGKLVLIDFWASWCGPCRYENPNVVAAYNKFHTGKFGKSKGFEIFSVSLDKDAAKWKAAIAKDQLAWPAHISDLQGWQSSHGALYGVNSIPMSFLVDGTGTIVGTNLRGAELEAKLASLAGKK